MTPRDESGHYQGVRVIVRFVHLDYREDDADELTVDCAGAPEVGWFDAFPDEMAGPVADGTRVLLGANR